jgi:putative transposase
MAAEGIPVAVACRVLDVSTSGYYAWRSRPPSARSIGHAWLTDLIVKVHRDSRRTYGALRVHAELRVGHGIVVGHNTAALLMRRAGLAGATGRPKWRHAKPDQVAADLVGRQFSRSGPNQLWVTDITEHPTREGKVSCAVVLDAFSRRVVGWSVDAAPTAALVTNALGMPSRPAPHRLGRSSTPIRGAVRALGVHPAGQGLRPGPPMGSVGDCYDHSMIEAFWSQMQVELLDRHRWRTRVEPADAILSAWRSSTTAPGATARWACSPRYSSSRHPPWHENPVTRLHGTRGTAQPPRNPGRFTAGVGASLSKSVGPHRAS